MRKFLLPIMMFVIVIIMIGCSDRSFTIDEVQIDAQINEDGTISVQELFTYDFDGSYEGMTRSIHSDVDHFQAYLTTSNNPTISTDGLEELTVEEDDDAWKIYTDSEDETKNVLYQYDIHGSVTKYQDVADLTYSFFDSSNETDLENVTISIHTPQRTAEDIHYFLHDDENGQLTYTDSGVQYTNPMLSENTNSEMRLVFPSEQLTAMEMDELEVMEASILEAEEELANRIQNLDEATGIITPALWTGIGIMLAVGVLFIVINPNRYRGNKGSDFLIRVFEDTDPLMNSYLHKGAIMPESFIAALFSLKQRGVVTLSEAPSRRTKGEYTYRFTWKKAQAKVDEADQFLRQWLFTESDHNGDFFLLESIQENDQLSDKEKEERAEKFNENFQQWKEKVMQRDSYQNLRRKFSGFSILSVVTTIVVTGLCYYLLTIQPVSPTEQLVLTIILGVFAIASIILRRQKWMLGVLYLYILVVPTIAFTLNEGTILSLVFYTITGALVLSAPAKYWIKDIRRRKYAIRHANHLYATNRYPASLEPKKLERRLENAIVIGAEEKYASVCGETDIAEHLKSAFPLIYHSGTVATTFNTSYMMMYPATYSSTTNTNTTSSTGGGGAGAF